MSAGSSDPARDGVRMPVAANGALELKTQRFTLRALSAQSDTAAFQTWSQDPRLMGPMNLPARILTASQVRDYWAGFDNQNRFFFGIFGTDGAAAGFWLVECEPLHNIATFHIAIDPARQGQGCALETGIALMDWLFAVRKIAKLNVLTLPDNAALRALLARLGFTEEGVLRQEIRNLTGEGRLDQLRFGLLPTDWRAAREAVQEYFNVKFGKTT